MEGSTGRDDAADYGGYGVGSCLRASKRMALAGLTCVFVVGGAVVGTITGALKGQTTETGLVHGAGIGAVAGAILSVELLESFSQGEPLSKIALLASLINGKIFWEWVSPAVLKAYQWQVNALELVEEETSDIFDTSTGDGITPEAISKLPQFEVCSLNRAACREISCAICLQDFKGGESARRLPICKHLYHMSCIDKWLVRHSSCPICRQDV